MLCPYGRVLLSSEEPKFTDTCNDTGESQKHCGREGSTRWTVSFVWNSWANRTRLSGQNAGPHIRSCQGAEWGGGLRIGSDQQVSEFIQQWTLQGCFLLPVSYPSINVILKVNIDFTVCLLNWPIVVLFPLTTSMGILAVLCMKWSRIYAGQF